MSHLTCRLHWVLFIAGFCSAVTLCQAQSQEAVSISTLLNEMVNRDGIARFPEPVFTCKQFSSYDRATVAKDKPGWFANSDRSMFLRVEKNDGRREFVMMDAEGPGAIVRFWMTFSGKDCGRGTMRIYIDENPAPVIEGTAFGILSGSKVASAPLGASVSELTPYERRGHNLYFPIPYAKRCIITYESANLSEDDYGAKKKSTEAVYYNINYRTYDRSIKVISYSSEEMKKNKNLIDNIQKKLAENARTPAPVAEQVALDASLQPGESKAFELKGPAAIQRLVIFLQAENKEQALRSTVIEIAFDGKKSVWTPIGDFFGIGYKQLYTNTWYASADKDGLMEAFWVMPFARQCTITLRNMGGQPVRIANASAATKAWHWDNRSMHFNASWRQYTRVLPGPEDLALDLNFANIKGKGVYAGDGIALFNTAQSWWGEGDEKIYVDGETFPSHIGTGTEDYYGYAWCRPEVFTDHPFIAQPYGLGSFEYDCTVNTRYRALDGIPFSKSLVFDMELWRNVRTRMNYAPIVFWYMMPGGQNMASDDIDGIKEPVVLNRSQIYPPALTPSVEGECLLCENVPTKNITYQVDTKRSWSEDMQLLWKNIGQGEKAVFSFNSTFEGSFTFIGLFTTAPNYGVFNIYMNGKIILTNLDLTSRYIITKKITAGKVNIIKGSNKLEVELVKLPGNSKTGSFGLDKLIFE